MHNNRFRRSNDRAAMPPLYPMPHAFHYPPPHVYHHHNQFLPHNFQPVPPIVTPKHESLPKDCFHVHQQFQHVILFLKTIHYLFINLDSVNYRKSTYQRLLADAWLLFSIEQGRQVENFRGLAAFPQKNKICIY